MKNIDILCWVYKNSFVIIFFCLFFQFPIFHSKIHKSCGALLRGGGGNSLKRTNIEGEWGRLGYMLKEPEQTRRREPKLEISNERTFWMPPFQHFLGVNTWALILSHFITLYMIWDAMTVIMKQIINIF